MSIHATGGGGRGGRHLVSDTDLRLKQAKYRQSTPDISSKMHQTTHVFMCRSAVHDSSKTQVDAQNCTVRQTMPKNSERCSEASYLPEPPVGGHLPLDTLKYGVIVLYARASSRRTAVFFHIFTLIYLRNGCDGNHRSINPWVQQQRLQHCFGNNAP